MNRRRLLSALLLVPGFAATAGAFGPIANRMALAQNPGDPAEDLLQAASEKMLEYDTMRFELTYERGSTKLFTGIKMTKVTGAIQRPGRLEATVKTKIGFVGIDVTGIVIGDQAWVRAVGISEDYALPDNLKRIIADPVQLIADLAQAVEDPVVSRLETTDDGTQLTWISGIFEPSLVQNDAVAGYIQRLGRQPVEIALDRENRIRSIRIAGRFASWDSDDVVRRLDIYDFGEPVNIEQP